MAHIDVNIPRGAIIHRHRSVHTSRLPPLVGVKAKPMHDSHRQSFSLSIDVERAMGMASTNRKSGSRGLADVIPGADDATSASMKVGINSRARLLVAGTRDLHGARLVSD